MTEVLPCPATTIVFGPHCRLGSPKGDAETEFGVQDGLLRISICEGHGGTQGWAEEEAKLGNSLTKTRQPGRELWSEQGPSVGISPGPSASLRCPLPREGRDLGPGGSAAQADPDGADSGGLPWTSLPTVGQQVLSRREDWAAHARVRHSEGVTRGCLSVCHPMANLHCWESLSKRDGPSRAILNQSWLAFS